TSIEKSSGSVFTAVSTISWINESTPSRTASTRFLILIILPLTRRYRASHRTTHSLFTVGVSSIDLLYSRRLDASVDDDSKSSSGSFSIIVKPSPAAE
ncbi:hypothetical protein PFISCL1PPCAC_28564, partial [Pristionchus fissidentatus]